jgi:hypothetical protein
MALTPKHVQDVCLAHQGYISCRYLSYDPTDNTFLCAKLHPRLKSIKDDAVRFNEREARRVNIPVIDYFDMHGIGHENNCSGYRYLKHTDQGYDMPKSP